MPKRLLFLCATAAYNAQITDHIKGVCGLLGVDFVEHAYTGIPAWETFTQTSGKFDFLYIAAHGNHACFGENNPPLLTRWADFGVSLCVTQVMQPGSVLFMGCCHGGLKRVSLILFTNCPQIVSVCGPRWKVSTHEVAVATHVFLHNLLIAEEEPTVAAERTAAALGSSFPLYDRYELEADIAVMMAHGDYISGDYKPTPAAPPVPPAPAPTP
jgi:hypothetical protein